MSFFKRKKRDDKQGFFTINPVDARFEATTELVKGLSRADYDKQKEAADLIHAAYQIMSNIRADKAEPTIDHEFLVDERKEK